jgi:hypothetical protein
VKCYSSILCALAELSNIRNTNNVLARAFFLLKLASHDSAFASCWTSYEAEDKWQFGLFIFGFTDFDFFNSFIPCPLTGIQTRGKQMIHLKIIRAKSQS